MTDSSSDITPEAAFGLVGHELRIAILRELGAAADQRLPFSELRERVGERDSGKFNYHLSKLTGRFVARTGEEYALTYPGHRVVDAVHEGAFHQQSGVDREPLSGACFDCGGALAFSYHTLEGGRVFCTDCERRLLRYPFDPGGLVDRSGDELAAAFDRVARANWRQSAANVCPVCSGHVRTWVRDDAPEKAVAVRGHETTVGLDCQQCSYHGNVPPGARLLPHPGVQGFYYGRGIDLREQRLWELPFVVDPARVAVRERGRLELAVTLQADGDERVATLDDEGTVVGLD